MPEMRTLSLLALLALVPAGSLRGPVLAAEPVMADALVGSASCAATACHGGERHELVPDQLSGGEYELWRSRDPHAAAHLTLESPQFARILERLGIASPNAEGGRPTIHSQAGLNECLRCHNPAGMTSHWSDRTTAASVSHAPAALSTSRSTKPPSPAFAIECESCHGPAQSWVNDHARRTWDRRLASQAGFRDLKHLLQRGQLCAQCHVGDSQRDMNHDMIAAGHPPLRFELASYLAKLPKHWNDRKERTLVPELELQLWLTGQLTGLDHSLALLESRVRRAEPNYKPAPQQRPAAPWPEFAEYGCTSCHQALTATAGSTKQGGPEPITLRWLNWNHGFLDTILKQPHWCPEHSCDTLAAEWSALRGELETGLEPEELVPFANDLHTWRLRLRGLYQAPWQELRGPREERRESVYTLLPALTPPLALLAWENQLPPLTHDQSLQAYSLLVATVQSRLDAASTASEPGRIPPAVFASLRRLKQQLGPLPERPFGRQVDTRETAFAEELLQVVQALEGATTR